MSWSPLEFKRWCASSGVSTMPWRSLKALGGFPPALYGVNDGGKAGSSRRKRFLLRYPQLNEHPLHWRYLRLRRSSYRRRTSQKLVSEYKVDLSIANAENSAGGFGITPLIAEELLALGLDVLTGGNHSFDKREIHDYLDRQTRCSALQTTPTDCRDTGSTQLQRATACLMRC